MRTTRCPGWCDNDSHGPGSRPRFHESPPTLVDGWEVRARVHTTHRDRRGRVHVYAEAYGSAQLSTGEARGLASLPAGGIARSLPALITAEYTPPAVLDAATADRLGLAIAVAADMADEWETP